MLRFVLRKIAKKKWMMLALLIGNALLVSITISNPMYTKAVLQRMLTRELSDFMVARNAYPGLISVRSGTNAARANTVFDGAAVIASIPERFDIEPIEEVSILYLNTSKALPDLVRDDDRMGKSITLGTMSDIEDHIRITAGSMYRDAPGEDGVIDVIVSERALLEMNLLMGEIIRMPNLESERGGEVSIRIAGVFSYAEAGDPYWVRPPRSYSNHAFMSESCFMERFVDAESPEYPLNAQWYTLLDYTAMRGDRAERLIEAAKEVTEYFTQSYNNSASNNFSAILTNYVAQARKVTVTLWILQAPIFVLLAAFIFMVSRQILETEQNEISVLKSRGSGKRQLIGAYLLQSSLLSLTGLAAGIPLGVYLCRVLGSSNAFLEFIKRKSLTLEFGAETALFAIAAAALAVAAMVIPVFKYANVTIVAHKQRKNAHRPASPLWQRMFLDMLVLGVALYGFYSFSQPRALEMLVRQVADGEALDPLVFLSSSLFIVGAGLFALRALPLVVFVVFKLFKRLWSPALYASFLRVIRARGSQGFITVFLIITIAMGIFNAQTARTINTNKEDNIRYLNGADVALLEKWEDNSAAFGGEGPGQASPSAADLVYYEPDYGKYLDLIGNGVEKMTKVLQSSDISMSVPGGTLKSVQLMGIHTREFGEVAWDDPTLLPHPFRSYLNAMAHDSRAVLLSSNFERNYGLKVGDAINYRSARGSGMRGIIYGFVDFWPGFAPYKLTRNSDGRYSQTEQFLVVAHLAQLQSSWGITPYHIWMKLEGSSQPIYDFAIERNILFSRFYDANAKILELKNDPVFQGTNGILTVGFIVVLLLCTVGFLIFWILSIRSRALQFGIFRAMGMPIREILSMLINEQVFISGLAIAMGVAVGRVASALYIPLIQIAYTAADQAVPVSVVSARADTMRLMGVVGAMMLACMAILGAIVKAMKIAQALKLGED